MTGPAQPRHRCTLLIVDLVESVRLLLVDEAGVIARWQRFIQDARHGPDSPVARAGGRVVKSLGDGLLVEVADVHGALPCAADLHGLIAALNVGVAPELQFRLRIGVHIAEVVRDELDLFGHGVNLAARLASLAGPGETVVSVACRDELASDDRLTLIDLGDCYLKHLPEPVRAFRVGPASPPGVSLDAPLAEGLGLALLPLQPLTEDPLGFGGALDYELQATLCGAQSLRVVSRLSVLPLLGLALEPAALGRRLRVDYLVSGAWRALGTQVEVHLEVTHAASGRLAGSAHGRVSRNSPCAADAGLRALAEAVLRTVFDAELTRHAPAALPNVASYALLHRGIGLMHRMSPAAAQSAESALEHLAERHPRAATPKAWLARWHLVRIAQAWAPDVGEAARRARDLVRQAIDADPSNALALALDGLLDSFVERRLDGAEQRYRQALHVDPNEPLAWMFLSALLAHRARGAESLQAMLRAEQLLPVDPTGFYRDGYGAWARLAAGDPSAAMQLARRSLQANRHHLPTYVTLAAAEALAGEHDAARVTAAALLLRRPGFSVQRYVDAFPGGINDHARRIGDALAAAGVPR